MKHKSKGKLIVIDGSDGSGKATQSKLLVKELKKRGHRVKLVDFPQYGKKSAGLVEEYLNGKYGEADEVGPYIASTFYAVDRYDASFKLKKWLEQGYIVISNRYVSSSMGHQAGKIKNIKERDKYLDWLYNLEYKMFGIPEPDVTFFLYVDPRKSQTWVDKKGAREYVGGNKRDIHEGNLKHLQDAIAAYKYVSKKFDWPIIEADKTIEEVHEEIMKYVEPLI